MQKFLIDVKKDRAYCRVCKRPCQMLQFSTFKYFWCDDYLGC